MTYTQISWWRSTIPVIVDIYKSPMTDQFQRWMALISFLSLVISSMFFHIVCQKTKTRLRIIKTVWSYENDEWSMAREESSRIQVPKDNLFSLVSSFVEKCLCYSPSSRKDVYNGCLTFFLYWHRKCSIPDSLLMNYVLGAIILLHNIYVGLNVASFHV